MTTLPAWLVSALAVLPLVQQLSAGLSRLTSSFDPGYRSRVWYKVWNAIATFPGSAQPTATEPVTNPAGSLLSTPKVP